MMASKTRKIRWAVISAETDAIQYKSYKPILSPAQATLVEVDIPDEEVIETGETIVVTPAGLAYMLGELAHGMYRDNARRITANSRRKSDE